MTEALYVDASAAIKLYRQEPGSDVASEAMASASALAASRVTYVEVARALGRVSQQAAERWQQDWGFHEAIEFNQDVAEHAASLSVHHGLRSLDAIHLASALTMKTAMRFATWDARLWDAAQAVGLRTIPEERP